ncbi:hypothetical protein LJB85_04050 [Porphyromonadaceae bacterium OttesenSCG-928-L07]|nr:hypothetical protein [Porphyromonadaceae bacterium OttesenSCG-928-L07]MDL2252115.1 hypothetical protein [Odoribacter sp. OttesenSCG-928-J03]MDL2330951.1 hypothetical protein [Odoribacter sp. OttesenSCG-928-A06]
MKKLLLLLTVFAFSFCACSDDDDKDYTVDDIAGRWQAEGIRIEKIDASPELLRQAIESIYDDFEESDPLIMTFTKEGTYERKYKNGDGSTGIYTLSGNKLAFTSSEDYSYSATVYTNNNSLELEHDETEDLNEELNDPDFKRMLAQLGIDPKDVKINKVIVTEVFKKI